MSAEIMCVALDMSVQYVQMRCVFAFVILQCVRHNGVYYLRHSADTLPRERERAAMTQFFLGLIK